MPSPAHMGLDDISRLKPGKPGKDPAKFNTD